MREVEKERKREGKNKRERKKIDASIEREAHGKERRGGSSQKERGELSKEKDRRPMRHRAGDDVVVVSRPSLTKSSQQIPVRPRSPVWTKSSSFLLRTSSRSSFFFFLYTFLSAAQWNSSKIGSWNRRKIRGGRRLLHQPWERVSFWDYDRVWSISPDTLKFHFESNWNVSMISEIRII